MRIPLEDRLPYTSLTLLMLAAFLFFRVEVRNAAYACNI